MSPDMAGTVEIAGGALAVAVVLFSGLRPLQLVSAIASCLCLGIRMGLPDTGHGNLPLVSASALAALLLMLFALWNLARRPGERWPYRVVIYSFYTAALACIGAYGEMAAGPTMAWPMDWMVVGGIYVIASASIALFKPWFAARMKSQVGRGK